VVLLGGITATDRPLDGDGEPGWWPAVGAVIDRRRTAVYAPALAGKGTTWPGMAGSTASAAELSDLVEAWLTAAGCPDGAVVVGASLGGLVGLTLAARRPARVGRLVVVSAGARPDGWGAGVRHLQRELVRDALAAGDAARGMSLARQLGMLTYRGRSEIDERFPVERPDDGPPPIAGYLDHHGRKFAAAFDPAAFLLLSDAIDRPPFGADRPGIRAALAAIRARVLVVGVPDDLLFPFRLQAELVEDLRLAGVEASLRTLPSVYGHDAFLADQEALARILDDAGVFAPVAAAVTAAVGVAAAAPAVRTLRLGLIGAGVVGQGLLALLHAQRELLAQRYGLAFEVVGIAVRDGLKDRGEHAQGIRRVSDPLALVRDPLVDVVVEVAGGVGSMGPVVRAALEAGKPVVTANKALLASELGPLAALARARGVPLVSEAAAAAALPVLRSLGRTVDRTRQLLGIVNGTCNYIVTRMEEAMPLEEALAIAQAKGFAEADPSADLDGHDAAAKLTLLAYRTFGAWVRPDAFLVRGVRELQPGDFALAELLGHRLRLIAEASFEGGALTLSVEPRALPAWHLLASVEEEYNAVYTVNDFAGDLAFFGKGAGGAPTATAVLSDLVDLGQGTAVAWPEPRALPVVDALDRPRRHLVRLDGAGASLARRAAALLRRAGLSVRASASLRGRTVRVAWILDEAAPRDLLPVLERLREQPGVERVVALGVVG
jgi:homoserine dehydrogenase